MLFDSLFDTQWDVIVLDLETTVQWYQDGNKWITDNSPFHPLNKCVSAHWRPVSTEEGRIGEAERAVFHHNEKPLPDSPESLREALKAADVIVCHNAKFDIMWLLEMGFKIKGKVYDTMIGEYIYARGRWQGVSLKDVAIRRGTTHKKDDLVGDMFKKRIGFEKMPLETVIDYADTDVLATAEIYLQQIRELEQENNVGLKPTFDLMHDMLWFLVEIERNGCHIDMEALLQVEQDFQREADELEIRLMEIVEEVMGDTPINLGSGADLCKVIYSRRVKDKDLHVKMFNIGTQANGKPKWRPKMKDYQFKAAVRATTAVVKRTVAHCCPTCNGSGQTRKIKKDGTPYKNTNKCKECGGTGAVYQDTGKVAGLKLVPLGPRDASIHGFKADKDSINLLIHQAQEKDNLLAVEFLEKMKRLNAVSTYLSSFVAGIKRWVRSNGILHPNFNQTVAKTSRLSCTLPNFQNLPKGKKFPVRKAIRSRWDGGLILEADFSGLEFRVAGILSGDVQIHEDIKNGKDVHRQTASIVFQIDVSEVDKETQRDPSKPHSFAPLYGGMGANEPPHIQRYYHEFFNIYSGVKDWHKVLQDGVLRNGIVRIPSGREYYWPNAKRYRNGGVSNATQIKNYPVQGFATGDIVPLACVRALREFRARDLKSKLILTVHDSIVVDVYPGELEAVTQALVVAMDVHDEAKERWNYELSIPLAIEIEAGPSWMEGSEIDLTPYREAA